MGLHGNGKILPGFGSHGAQAIERDALLRFGEREVRARVLAVFVAGVLEGIELARREAARYHGACLAPVIVRRAIALHEPVVGIQFDALAVSPAK